MSMFYKLASAVLARTTGRAVVAHAISPKDPLRLWRSSVRRRSGARPHFEDLAGARRTAVSSQKGPKK